MEGCGAIIDLDGGVGVFVISGVSGESGGVDAGVDDDGV